MKPKSNIWRRFRSTGEEQPIGTQPPTGTIVAFAGTTIPGGWIQVTSTQLAATYPALATLYGTSGSNVALPVMTDQRVMMGGTSSIFTTGGLDSATLSAAESGVRETDAYGGHGHDVNTPYDADHSHSITQATNHVHATYILPYAAETNGAPNTTQHNYWNTTNGAFTTTDSMNLTLSSVTTGIAISDSGGAAASNAHLNLQPTLSLFFIVKT